MKTLFPLLLALGVLVACGEADPTPTTTPGPADVVQKGKLRVEYYEISKK